MAPVHCDLYASPSGSDALGAGSLAAPFGTVQKLDQTLRPGQTGCLRAGSYGSISTLHRIYASGTAAARLTIRSAPGETATVVGYVDIEGSYTTLSHLRIDGSNTFYTGHPSGISCPAPVSQPLGIEGRNDTLEYDDYFQSVPSLRAPGSASGSGTTLTTRSSATRRSTTSASASYDHLVYLSHGNNVQIYANWMTTMPMGAASSSTPPPPTPACSTTSSTTSVRASSSATRSSHADRQPHLQQPGHQRDRLPTQGLPGEAIHDLYGGLRHRRHVLQQPDLQRPGPDRAFDPVSAYGDLNANPQFVNSPTSDFAVATSGPASAWHLWNGLS